MTIGELYNIYLDACGVPKMPDVYFWPPRQSEQVIDFLDQHDPEFLKRLSNILWDEAYINL